MDDKDPCFIVKGNDPVGFHKLEEKIMSIASKLASMECNNGSISDAPAPHHHYESPPLEIPTFDGDYTKWRSFKDQFLAIVDLGQLSCVDKFICLRQSLTDECIQLIGYLPLTNDNYTLAWRMLEKRYDYPRQVIKIALDRLLNLEKAQIGCRSSILKKIHGSFLENTHLIRSSCDSPGEVNEVIFHQLLLNKLDPKTSILYEQSLDDPTKPQSVENLMTFLVKRFKCLERIEAGETNYSTHQNSSKPQFPKWKRKNTTKSMYKRV